MEKEIKLNISIAFEPHFHTFYTIDFLLRFFFFSHAYVTTLTRISIKIVACYLIFEGNAQKILSDEVLKWQKG